MARLLRKQALNMPEVVNKFLSYIKDKYSEDKIHSSFKILNAGLNESSFKSIQSDQFVGKNGYMEGILFGKVKLTLLTANDLKEYLKNHGVKKQMSFKERLKNMVSDNESMQKKLFQQIWPEVIKYMRAHIKEFIEPHLRAIIVKCSLQVLKDLKVNYFERPDSVTDRLKQMTDWDYSLDSQNGEVIVSFKTKLYKLVLGEGAKNPDMISSEFKKATKYWRIADDLAQMMNYVKTNCQNIARKMQYEKMSGKTANRFMGLLNNI